MRRLCSAAAAAVAMLVMAAASSAADENEAVELKVGDPAPQFTLLNDQGEEWKSEDHYGEKIVVIYFYPADMTPGCTSQACAYRDDQQKLIDKGVEVVGISGDSVRNHQLFKRAHDLNFTLLSDPMGETAAKFGVPFQLGEKSIEREIDGEAFTLTRTATIRRWTAVVDKDGKIAEIREVETAGEDSKTILELVDSLQ